MPSGFLLTKMFAHPIVASRMTKMIPMPDSTDPHVLGGWVTTMLRINGFPATDEGNGRVRTTPKGFISGHPDCEVHAVIQVVQVIHNDLWCTIKPTWSYGQDSTSHETIHRLFGHLV